MLRKDLTTVNKDRTAKVQQNIMSINLGADWDFIAVALRDLANELRENRNTVVAMAIMHMVEDTINSTDNERTKQVLTPYLEQYKAMQDVQVPDTSDELD